MNYQRIKNEDAQGILSLWNKEIGNEFPMRPELFRQNTLQSKGLDKEASWVAYDEKQSHIIGFIVIKTNRTNTGFIQAVLVDSQYRERGIGSELLSKAEASMKQTQLKCVEAGGGPGCFFPGIPEQYVWVKEWFKTKGYIYRETYHDLYRDLRMGKNCIRRNELSNAKFRIMTLELQDKLIAFLRKTFPVWEQQAVQYFKEGGEGREYIVLEQAEEIIGFCRVNDKYTREIGGNMYWSSLFEDDAGGIGPVGISDKHQGKGFGYAIVNEGVRLLRSRGVDHIVIDWIDKLVFYKKLDFNIWKTYDRYMKTLQ